MNLVNYHKLFAKSVVDILEKIYGKWRKWISSPFGSILRRDRFAGVERRQKVVLGKCLNKYVITIYKSYYTNVHQRKRAVNEPINTHIS